MHTKDTLRLAIVQEAPIPRSTAATLQLMEDYVMKAGYQGKRAELIVFPELFVTGYLSSYWESPPSPADEKDWMERLTRLCAEHHVWMITGHPSYCVPELDGRMANAASLISPAGVVGTYAKVHLFGEEPESFAYGKTFPVWDTPWGRIAIQICYDLEFPEAARMAALHGADILINPDANMHPFGEHHRRYTMVRAMENGMFVATVNRLGTERDLHFCGCSCVAHPDGRWLLDAVTEPGLYLVDIPVSERSQLDPTLDYLRGRRPNTYGQLALPRTQGAQ